MHRPLFGEEGLVSEAKRGDDGAFGALVRHYYAHVHFTVRERVGAARAGEATAQTFAVAYRRIGEVEPGAFARWLEELAERCAATFPPPFPDRAAEQPAAAYQAVPGRHREELEPWDLADPDTPEQVIALGDYFQARRGFPSDEALAAACGIDLRRLRVVKRGEPADAEAARVLADVATVVRLLLAHYEPAAALDWLEGLSPDLDGRRPLGVLREGGLPDVVAALQAQTSGAYL